MNRLACDCIIQDKLHVQAGASYRPRHDGGPVSLTAPVPSVSVVTGPRALSPLVRLVMATGPGPRQPGPAPQLTVCCTGSAGPGLRNSSVSHSALARPATSDTGDPSYSEPVSPERERVLVTHCQPPVRSDIHQCWGSGDSIQCVLTTEESVRHWPRVSLGSLGVTRPLVTDCDMWDCEPCDHQHQPRLTVSHPAPLKVKIQLRQSQSENGN